MDCEREKMPPEAVMPCPAEARATVFPDGTRLRVIEDLGEQAYTHPLQPLWPNIKAGTILEVHNLGSPTGTIETYVVDSNGQLTEKRFFLSADSLDRVSPIQ